jgi:multicomponent Na+:H+ antiporter subunit E
MRYSLSLTAVLFGMWLLWSGHYVPLLMTIGLVASVAVVLVVGRMSPVDRETVPLAVGFRILLYLPWLLREVVTSNLDVARRILDPRLPIRPVMVRVRAGQRSELGLVIHANSITLTPGTVSVGIDGGVITVHALTEEAGRAVQSGEMDRRVSRCEGRP